MKLRNPAKEIEVEIDEETAISQFSIYAGSISFMSSSDGGERLLPVDCDIKVLNTIQRYATDFHATHRQITSWANLTTSDKEIMGQANKEKWLISLYDTAFLIGFDGLKDLCAAYLSYEIDRIAMMSETPMVGAERIRDFLDMKNDWTDEEMEHLRKEMDVAVQADPRAY